MRAYKPASPAQSKYNQRRSEATWPAGKVARLTEHVEAGVLSFEEIALDLGISKNAAIGKAGRLGLDGPRMKGPIGVEPSTLGERLAALDVFPPKDCCVYPIDNPGAPHFRFCAELAIENRPYCEEHAHGLRGCYQKSAPSAHAAEPKFVWRGGARRQA